MAADDDKILLRVGLDTTEAQQQTEALKEKIAEVGKTPISDTPVKGYKAAIRELTAELQILERTQGRNSQAFRDGAAQLGKLKLAAADFKDIIESANPALGKFGAVSNIAKGAAVGITAAASSLALFGVNGAKAQEVMLKLQAILGLSHAISSIHELASGWNSFKLVLGLTSKNIDTLTDAQKIQNSAVVDGAAEQVTAKETVIATIGEQQAAELELATVTAELDELKIQSAQALAAVRAEGLDATIAMTASEEVYLQSQAEILVVKQKLLDVELRLNAAKGITTEETVAATTASVAETTATEAATGSAIGLRVALSAIGIGLLITAIAYVVSNWKEFKKSITDLFPQLAKTKSIFTDLQNVLLGVGSVIFNVLKGNIDIVVAVLKTFNDIVHGDFKAALNDVGEGFKKLGADLSFWNTYREGVAKAEAKDALVANQKRIALEIEANERVIKARKALGLEVADLETKNIQLKIQNLDKDKLTDEEYAKQKLDLENDITVAQNTEIKKRNDKAAALRKQDLDKLKTGQDAASKVILGGLKSEREIQIADADFKYNALIAIAEKYGKDSSKLVEARGIEETRINKKYADTIKAYLIKADEDTLSDFDKKRIEITKAAEEALKNANPQQKQAIIQSQTFQLTKVDREEKLSDKAEAAQVNQTNVEDANRPGVGVKPDSLEVQYAKEQAIRDARLAVLKTQYDKERDLKQYNYDELQALDSKYQKDSHALEDENTKAKIELSKAEKEARLKDIDIVGNALGAFGALMGKNTVAAKLLGVANATISTYVAASQTLADPTLPFFAKFAAVAGTIATGLAQVKNILSVKVPGGSGGATAPSYAAPQINSTVLNQAQAGVQQVQVVNQPNTTTKQEPIEAYIVQKKLTSSLDRAAYLDRQSTI